ncbi:hypothetical protein DPMN_088144 [Dreissena polymorpha]|uniref:Uncharacterized protein n=1 Tax=Dreissena polymorpha TaxID=45954 RepID=A0A9D4KUI4_DREPO|nr:hypothetical protein DPMN_088144 [Dreissena polymorpha]
MYAFSPGLWADAGHDMWAWSLVLVEPLTGTVTKQCDIAPRGGSLKYKMESRSGKTGLNASAKSVVPY